MSRGTVLLDEALDLARQEKDALERGEYTEAIELAQKRSEITGMAWNFFDMKDKSSYHNRLLQLADLQTRLTSIASRAHESIRQKLSRSRQEKKRIKGYHLAIEQALQ